VELIKIVLAGDICMDKLYITYKYRTYKSPVLAPIKESRGLFVKTGFKIFRMKMIYNFIKRINLNMKVHQSLCAVNIYLMV